MRPSMRHLAGVAAAIMLGHSGMAASAPLRVYTALETEQLRVYEKAFNQVHPDIQIEWVRDSTGVITARLLAEQANPKADVILGVAASSMALFAENNMLQAYVPAGLAAIDERYRDTQTVPRWVGMNAFAAVICFNRVEAKKKNIPLPATWQDLTDPVYKNQVVMPHPASSGTGYFDVYAWLELFGKESSEAGQAGGWDYMDALHQNIAQYTHSGSKPCNMAAQGEYVAGISFDYRGLLNQSRGAPIELVFPDEGLGWDLEAVAVYQGTSNQAAAEKLMDWAVSPAAMQLYSNSFPLTAIPKISDKADRILASYGHKLIEQDFTQMYLQRDEVLREWSNRYEGKSEEKQP